LNALGALALVFYAAHVAWHVSRGTAGDLIWACNVAVPLLAIGCFLGPRKPGPSLVASAVLWLSYGAPLWVLDISTGGDFVPTSIFTHFGGLAIGIVGVRRNGWPRHSWLVASGGTAVLLGITRLVGSPERNANLAFRVHDGWEKWFASHPVYLATMWLGSALVFFVIERIVLWRISIAS
jgi:hypothetical protein